MREILPIIFNIGVNYTHRWNLMDSGLLSDSHICTLRQVQDHASTNTKQSVVLPHAFSHEEEQVVNVREDEEEKDRAKEHGHPGAMVLTKHLQS